MEEQTLAILKQAQRFEITEQLIYRKLAAAARDDSNRRVLLRIADEEQRHYALLAERTGFYAQPNMLRVWLFVAVSRLFGITFGLRLMEKGEDAAQKRYRRVLEELPELRQIADEEEAHEQQLLSMIDEERLRYVGSVVLGLNDALVELTGALAGLTFAFQKTSAVAVAGLVTGIAAALSMASS